MEHVPCETHNSLTTFDTFSKIVGGISDLFLLYSTVQMKVQRQKIQ